MSLLTRMMQPLERRSTLSNPSDWLREALGATPTVTGRSVTPESSLRLVAVYSCVRIIAETIASLPLPVYRRLDRGRERAPNHPLWPVLHDQANRLMTSMEWRETTMGHVLLWGNAYSDIERNEGGRIIGLWPLRPDRMEVEWDEVRRLARYRYTLSDGRQLELDPANLLHVRGLSPNGVIGYSPIHMAREAVGLGLALEEYGARFFGNGSRPGGVLIHPGKLSEEGQKRLKASWEATQGGLTNAHRVAILEEGMTWQAIGMPPADVQFAEGRKLQLAEIARIFRVPLHLLDETDKAATYASVEQFALQFVVHTIRPWLVRLEQAIQRDLFSVTAPQRSYFAKFSVEGLLRGDTKSRYDGYQKGILTGWLTRNEARELEDLNPLPGLDEPLAPTNMAPAAQLGQGPEEEGGNARED